MADHDPAYRGDFTGILPELSYAPYDDDVADPGEVVWAWVPYEEDHQQGKDRPVLVLARLTVPGGIVLLAVPLTSKDHDRDAEQEAAAGRHWIDIGTGDWDREHRPSEARIDRLLQLDPDGVRRIGGRVSAEVFAAVVAVLQPGR